MKADEAREATESSRAGRVANEMKELEKGMLAAANSGSYEYSTSSHISDGVRALLKEQGYKFCVRCNEDLRTVYSISWEKKTSKVKTITLIALLFVAIAILKYLLTC